MLIWLDLIHSLFIVHCIYYKGSLFQDHYKTRLMLFNCWHPSRVLLLVAIWPTFHMIAFYFEYEWYLFNYPPASQASRGVYWNQAQKISPTRILGTLGCLLLSNSVTLWLCNSGRSKPPIISAACHGIGSKIFSDQHQGKALLLNAS